MNYTKYSLANMLLVVTVVVLCSIIVFDRQKRTVSLTGVDGGYFEFEVPEVGAVSYTHLTLPTTPYV